MTGGKSSLFCCINSVYEIICEPTATPVLRTYKVGWRGLLAPYWTKSPGVEAGLCLAIDVFGVVVVDGPDVALLRVKWNAPTGGVVHSVKWELTRVGHVLVVVCVAPNVERDLVLAMGHCARRVL